MPQTISATATQNYTIPSDVASIRVRLFGAGGGGEFIANDAFFSSTAGTSGGSTSFIGMVAGGGQAGGIGGKNLGGAGGTTSLSYAWDTAGVSLTRTNGSNGGITNGGAGASLSGYSTRNGGNGTEGQTTYNSSVYHVFDNGANTHTITITSPDITVSYEGAGAADGLPCSNNLGYKHYAINFNQPFLDSNYTITIYNICQQAAGGGTGGSFYLSGIDYKTQFGFRAWFCRSGNNGYVRCFEISCSGIKPAQRGVGGGGGSLISGTVTRAQLQNSLTYAPGTTHAITIGAAGARGGNTASNGTIGFAELYVLLVPNVTLTLDSSAIIRGNSTILRWSTTGDADTGTLSPGNTVINVNGNQTVNPIQTTTYTVTVSGLGGSNTKTITLVVYQPPQATIDAPTSLNYGSQGTVSYTATYANTSLSVIPTYTYDSPTGTVTGTTVTLTPTSSAELGATGSSVTGSFTTAIPYTTKGPRSVTYKIVAQGSGGSTEVVDSTTIIIDETPDNVIIPETDDAFKDQDPVITPDGTVITEVILINDIDIPVEIKADRPIQVNRNSSGTWENLRQIT